MIEVKKQREKANHGKEKNTEIPNMLLRHVYILYQNRSFVECR